MATDNRLRREHGGPADGRGRAAADEVARRVGWTGPARPASLVPGACALINEVIDALTSGRAAGDVRLPPELHLLVADAVAAGVGHDVARELTRAVHRAAGTVAFADPRLAAEPSASAACSAWLVDHLGAMQDQLDHLVATALSTRAQAARGRALLVQEVLDERPGAAARLGYDLHRAHVGLLGWSASGDTLALEHAVEQVARAIGSSLLMVALPDGTVAAWGVPDEGDLRARAASASGALAEAGVLVALSGPRTGATGFRSVHADVVRAAAVARATGPLPHGIVWFADLRLEALLLADEPAARAFVEAELGELLGGQAELLETLEAVLDADGDATRAAARVGVEPETVAERMRLIHELLGDVPVEHRLETRVALRLARAGGPAARRPQDP